MEEDEERRMDKRKNEKMDGRGNEKRRIDESG